MAQVQHFLVQNIDIIYKKDPVFVLFSLIYIYFLYTLEVSYIVGLNCHYRISYFTCPYVHLFCLCSLFLVEGLKAD